MSIRSSVACCFAVAALSAPAAMAEEIHSTPITAASTDSPEGDRWWGPGGLLIPEAEWRPYVGRRQALSGADPARMTRLSGTAAARKSGTAKRAGAAKVPAAKPNAPKSVDPCEEKVRQALEEAARSGKIPASAVPPASGQAPAAVPAAPARTGTNAPANRVVTVPGGVVGTVQAAPSQPPPPFPGS